MGELLDKRVRLASKLLFLVRTCTRFPSSSSDSAVLPDQPWSHAP